MTTSIHKAAGIIIKDRKLLITRTRGKDFFVAPGGKLEAGETSVEALARELKEELSIEIVPEQVEKLDTYTAVATGTSGTQLQMDVYFVHEWNGDIVAQAEVEELRWVDSLPLDVEIGSIFQHDVIPELKQQGLID